MQTAPASACGLGPAPFLPARAARSRLGDYKESSRRFGAIRMKRTVIKTDEAPAAVGTYSQALRVGSTVYLSGQIALDPKTVELVQGDMRAQVERVFSNLQAVATAAGGNLADIVKLTVYLTDLSHFALVNEVMASFFSEPYPARAAVGVSALPKGAAIEIEGVMELRDA